jgi:hypothetical protein
MSKNANAKRAEAVRSFALKSIETSTKALMGATRKSLEAEFSPAFAMTGGEWAFKDRDDLIDAVSTGRVKYEYINTHIDRVDAAAENVAIVTGKRSVVAVVDGKDFASKFRFTAVHVRDGDQWQVAHWAVNC